jgi:Ubiquitin elongating factor core
MASSDAGLTYLFEAHPLVQAHLVPALLSVYADVEHTDRANQVRMDVSGHLPDDR